MSSGSEEKLIYYHKLVIFMMRKTTSIKVNPEFWKKVKKHCIDIDKDISDYLEDLVKQDLARK